MCFYLSITLMIIRAQNRQFRQSNQSYWGGVMLGLFPVKLKEQRSILHDSKWSTEAVLLLIDLRTESSSLFSSNTTTQKQAWRKISEEMCSKGHSFSGDECDRKYRSLKMRYKIIKERNNKTGNSRQCWKYFDAMDKVLHGDPAVQPVAAASSLSVLGTQKSVPLKPTPSSPKKRKSEKESGWVTDYRMELKKMHQERMELDRQRLNLEERRVQALEHLAEALNK
ncbi:uncharacterized protein LOC133171968 [Saccostrea echinata]|uniref:uncharacterized protein LOC133171968 n=1 Tax=Saccostrea echinata TaxID=191078 RepID=UPI002A815EE4|nr:uncharacterized protein LOC133171968 [Saccostrea echinata]